jgi:hypothetical protein
VDHNEDKRRHARFDLGAFATLTPLSCEDMSALYLYADNISCAGAYFRTNFVFPLGTRLKVRVFLASRITADGCSRDSGCPGIARITTEGYVSRVDDDGMAVAFCGKHDITSV